MFGVVDLAAVKSGPRAILFCFRKELERVVRRARTAAENPHDQMRIVLDEFPSPRAVVDDLQKHRPAACATPRECARCDR